MADDLLRIYDQHGHALFAFLLNWTRNEADTRDILQEVFLKLARRPALLKSAGNERAFLLRLAHNVARDRWRRETTRSKHESSLALESVEIFSASENPDEQLFRERVASALSEVPAEQRAIVHLKLWENLTFEAIGETLQISPHTAASRYRYALDKLRARLRPLRQELL
jgi:RNA polymerase sigma-70 factor (ECF subfamily)